MATTYTVQVTASALNVRTGPSTSYKIKTVIYKGKEYKASKKSNGWYYIDSLSGWASGVSTSYLKVVSSSADKPKSVPVPTQTSKTTEAKSTSQSLGIDAKVLQMLLDSAKKQTSKIDASMRLFGAPHQFTKQVDLRTGDGQYTLGRKYLETIVTESPIVYFLPGRPNFLPNVSESERSAFKTFFEKMTPDTNDNKSALSAILKNKDVRYFDFVADYATYMKYVNLLCRVTAIYMGIGDEYAPIDGTVRKKYKWFDWSNYRYKDSWAQKNTEKQSIFDLAKETGDNIYESLFGNWQYTQFYVDPNTSFQESTSNQTAQSKIASAIESGQQLLKEAAFLTDTVGLGALGNLASDSASQLNDSLIKSLGNNSFLGRMSDIGTTVLSGANIVFPEIWGDAAYNKSYNVTINLVSPYGDLESIYLNIMVPLMHLLALALPRQTGANSFASPFLVKVSSKGWFNCEMGIIDNMTVEKVQGSWSVNGLPTEVKVSIGIKDLYSTLMMTPNSKPELFFENKGLMNWLAVTAGIDITEPAFKEKWNALLLTLFNRVVDIPQNIANTMIEEVRNFINPLFKI